MRQRIAIIGAGMSGVACANKLITAGLEVSIFDKGRALGGRLATRLSDGWSFNHGAPSFHADEIGFRNCIEHLVAAGSARCIDEAERLYSGNPHMNTLLAPLVNGIELHQSIEISEITRNADGWHLSSGSGQVFERFDCTLICIPAPQAQNLIGSIKADWSNSLEVVRYDPCLTMLLGLSRTGSGLRERCFEGHSVLTTQLRQRGQDKSGGAAGEAWVAHATPAWSKQHVDREREEIAQTMLQEFSTANDLPDIEATFLRGHRWRYAQVSRPLGESCLWDKEIKLGAAGDWCIGPDVESAFVSGSKLADQVLLS